MARNRRRIIRWGCEEMILVAARTGWEAENKGKEKADEGGR